MGADAGRRALVQEIMAGRESILQAIWAHQLIGTRGLRTSDGAELQILFPGWLNRDAGPDFRNARLQIGRREVMGDVEIHLDARDWRNHGHARDGGYDGVVLHVVLRSGGETPLRAPESGRPIPELNVAPYLGRRMAPVLADPENLLRRYEDLPGRCGLRALKCGHEALNAVIALSILFLGPEIVRTWRGESSFTIRHPWVVAFGFGLLHGFGFAKGLIDMGLPSNEIPLALLFFNVGVEVGQLWFVALVLALTRSFSVLEIRWPRWAQLLPGYAVGTLGAFWFIQRTAILLGWA